MSFSHQFYLAIRLGFLLNLNIRQSAYYQIRITISFDDTQNKVDMRLVRKTGLLQSKLSAVDFNNKIRAQNPKF